MNNFIQCPWCKESIENNYPYCDQCGKQILYCSQCSRPDVNIRKYCMDCGKKMGSAGTINNPSLPIIPSSKPPDPVNAISDVKITQKTNVDVIQSVPKTPAPPNPPVNMVFINGGTFIMGSPTNESEGIANERPQHQVTVNSFYMGKFQVIQMEYERIMGAIQCNFKGSQLPVEKVSWFDAIEYCNQKSQKEGLTPVYTKNSTNDKLSVTWNRNANGFRLPTEAEWEYACRARSTTPFNTGSNITTDQANYSGNNPYKNNAKGINRKRTTDVGYFEPNDFGLFDMHGNVMEWCWDWFGNYGGEIQKDPIGASSGVQRVCRGGSWTSSGQYARSAFRLGCDPYSKNNFIGFRIVRSL